MERPQQVGILALEIYFPKRYVAQTDLEARNECIGKYTVGLGQDRMAFTDDSEDVGSIMLTVTESLLSKYNVSPSDVGRLEIGTETLVDKSKSIKTTLMRLFPDNLNMEGVTCTNACYGGSAALFNTVAWVQGEDWDGKYGLVVCGDIAVYEEGPARPTGGCSAVAMLIGPHAPLVLVPGVRGTCAIEGYDFYKPCNHLSEYALVDGKLSQWAYLYCLEKSYELTLEKMRQKDPTLSTQESSSSSLFDFFAFHTPYCKLAQKGFAKLAFLDFLRNKEDGAFDAIREQVEGLLAQEEEESKKEQEEHATQFFERPLHDPFANREIEKIFRTFSEPRYNQLILNQPPESEDGTTHNYASSLFSNQCGNGYTSSIFGNLCSLVCRLQADDVTANKKVLCYSYGSGSIGSTYVFQLQPQDHDRFNVANIQAQLNLEARLNEREQASLEEYDASLRRREDTFGSVPLTTSFASHQQGEDDQSISHFYFEGTYAFSHMDEQYRRYYAKVEY